MIKSHFRNEINLTLLIHRHHIGRNQLDCKYYYRIYQNIRSDSWDYAFRKR